MLYCRNCRTCNGWQALRCTMCKGSGKVHYQVKTYSLKRWILLQLFYSSGYHMSPVAVSSFVVGQKKIGSYNALGYWLEMAHVLSASEKLQTRLSWKQCYSFTCILYMVLMVWIKCLSQINVAITLIHYYHFLVQWREGDSRVHSWGYCRKSCRTIAPSFIHWI